MGASYHAGLGRFLSRDRMRRHWQSTPFPGAVAQTLTPREEPRNLYLFGDNNPVSSEDPSGRQAYKNGDKLETETFGTLTIVGPVDFDKGAIKKARCLLEKMGYNYKTSHQPAYLVTGITKGYALAVKRGGTWELFISEDGVKNAMSSHDHLNLAISLAHEIDGHISRNLSHKKKAQDAQIEELYDTGILDKKLALMRKKLEKPECCKEEPNVGVEMANEWQKAVCDCGIKFP